MSVSRRHEETFKADWPLAVVHLAHRFLISSSESVFVDSRLLVPGSDYWVDHREGMVYLTSGVPPGVAVRVKYSALPVSLMPEYRLRKIEEGKLAGTAPAQARAARGSKPTYDLKASGSKTVSVETGSLKDFHVSQALNLSLAGKVGENVEVRGVLADHDMSFGETASTGKLRDMDRIFLEARSSAAYARLGDLEIDEKPGDLLSIRRNLTGFFASASAGPGKFTASGASARSVFRSAESVAREGISGPYVIAERSGLPADLVVASEQVWLDGEPMKRGRTADYTIDYDKAEIYFNPGRTIREGSRIVVDYQEQEDTDGKQLYLARSDFALWGMGSVGVSYVNETSVPEVSGDRDQPYGQAGAVGGSGDAPGAAGKYVGPGQGEYVLVEGAGTSYFEYVGEAAGDYLVAFTWVGEGRGSYAYVFSEKWQRYIHAYTGVGQYLPGVPAIPGLRSQVVHVSGSLKPLSWLELKSEVARSQGNSDGVRPWGEVRKGGAYTVGLTGTRSLPRARGRETGLVSLTASRRSVDSAYVAFGRVRRPDFTDVWAQPSSGGREETDQISLAYALGEKVKAGITLGALQTADGVSSRRSLNLSVGDQRMGLRAASDIARADWRARRGLVNRDEVSLSVPVGWVGLSIGRKFDSVSRAADTTSYRATEYYSALDLLRRSGRARLTVSREAEERDLGSGWLGHASGINSKLEIEKTHGGRLGFRGLLSHRIVDYADRVDAPDGSATGADLTLTARDFLGVSLLALDYSLANTLTSVYAVRLVKVQGGGEYDSLGNYVPGAGTHDASRVETGKRPVTRMKTALVVETGLKGKVSSRRSLSSRTGVEVEAESSSRGLRHVALPEIGFILNDASMALGRVSGSQEVSLRRSGWPSVGLSGRVVRLLDGRCTGRRETSRKTEVGARLAHTTAGGMSAALETRMTSSVRRFQAASSTASPAQTVWTTGIDLERQMFGALRSRVRLEYTDEQRRRPTSSTSHGSLAPGVSLISGTLRIDAGLSLRRVIRSDGSTAAGNQWRDSVAWNLRLNLRRGRYTSFSVDYTGSRPTSLASVHNFRASLSANF